MDVLFTIAMLGLMAAAIVALGRAWPRSSRGGGYRAGRGYGAGDASATVGESPPVPEVDDAPWHWTRDDDGAVPAAHDEAAAAHDEGAPDHDGHVAR